MGRAIGYGLKSHQGHRCVGHWAVIASAVALCVACGSDDDDDSDDSGSTGGTGAQTSGGSSSGGQAATGATGGGVRTGGTGGRAGDSSGGAPDAGGSAGTAGSAEVAGSAGEGGSPGPGGATSGGGEGGGAGDEAGGGAVDEAGGAGAGGVAGLPSGGGTAGVAGTAGAAGTGRAGAGGEGGTAAVTPGPLGLYVACADSTGSIMYFTLDPAAWTITPIGTYTTGVSNSWATLDAAQELMYVASRTEGRIATLARDTATGALTPLDSVEVPMAPPAAGGAGGAGGAGNPATQTLTLDGTGDFLLATNYSANYLYVYTVEGDGTVGSIVASQDDGVSSHHAVFAPGSDNELVLVPYRGSDAIVSYRFDDSDGALAVLSTLTLDTDGTDATTGPRHLAFHPTEDTWVYVINEVAGSVGYLTIDNSTGELTEQQTLSSVPGDYTEEAKFASEIAVAPSGEFLYVSNRYGVSAEVTTEGSLGVFAIDQSTGELSSVEFQGSRGALPRHFILSDDGSVLVVGNQNSNNIAVFSVNTETGALTHRVTRDVCATPFFVQLMGE